MKKLLSVLMILTLFLCLGLTGVAAMAEGTAEESVPGVYINGTIMNESDGAIICPGANLYLMLGDAADDDGEYEYTVIFKDGEGTEINGATTGTLVKNGESGKKTPVPDIAATAEITVKHKDATLSRSYGVETEWDLNETIFENPLKLNGKDLSSLDIQFCPGGAFDLRLYDENADSADYTYRVTFYNDEDVLEEKEGSICNKSEDDLNPGMYTTVPEEATSVKVWIMQENPSSVKSAADYFSRAWAGTFDVKLSEDDFPEDDNPLQLNKKSLNDSGLYVCPGTEAWLGLENLVNDSANYAYRISFADKDGNDISKDAADELPSWNGTIHFIADDEEDKWIYGIGVHVPENAATMTLWVAINSGDNVGVVWERTYKVQLAEDFGDENLRLNGAVLDDE